MRQPSPNRWTLPDLGLGVGLFTSGANRLLVLLALAPAAAMAATLVAREEETSTKA